MAPQIESMAFWSDLLPEAMTQLSTISEVGNRKQSGYSIRNLTTWEGIKEKLERAQVQYGCQENGGNANQKFGSRLKSSTRKLVDGSIGPLQQAVNFVPNIEMASPVTTTVKMLLSVRRHEAIMCCDPTLTLDRRIKTQQKLVGTSIQN